MYVIGKKEKYNKKIILNLGLILQSVCKTEIT